ncbi:MAG: hypothetical protein U0166_13025 [Acidobacteriota bacterium]
MSKRKASAPITAFCPDCDQETPHAAPQENSKEITCLTCKLVHEQEEPEGDGAADTDVLEEADEERAEHGEEEEGEGEDHDTPDSEASSDPAGEEIDGDEPVVPARGRLHAEEEEAEEEDDEEEDDDDEGDEEPSSYGDDESEVAGLSAYGRSSFASDQEADEPEEEAAPKKRKTARKKSTGPKVSADVRSWEEEVARADERKARSYSFTETYRIEEIIKHSKFGMGKVVEVVNPTKISVLFKEGRKMMLQGQR